MISATAVNNSIQSVSYNSISSGMKNGTDKVYVPVKPSNVVYTQFDYVSGVAAKPNQAGVTVSKVQILNSLIDQLVSMKAYPKIDSSKDFPLDDKRIDVLIDSFQTKLQTTIQTAQATGYGLAGATPEPGILFTVDA